MKQPKMSMSLDRLFFFWRKGDSLLIEKREQDLFERMKIVLAVPIFLTYPDTDMKYGRR